MPDETDTERGQTGQAARSGSSSVTVKVLVAGVVVAVVLGGVALGIAAGTTGSTARPVTTCTSSTPKLTVQGTGQSSIPPDLLTVMVNVNASGPSATAALTSDDVKVTGVAAAFKNGGVAEKDIQTSGLSLQPQYAYPKGVPTVTGYQVNNTITATLRDVSKAGTLIDSVVGAAGNAVQIQSIAFSLAHPSATEDKARATAVSQAVSHAKAMATAAGRSLGPVCSLTDQTQLSGSLDHFGASGSALQGDTAAALPVPIESGTQTETAQITLVYALRPAAAHHAGNG